MGVHISTHPYPLPHSLQPPLPHPTMSSLTRPGISLTFPKDSLNTPPSNPHSDSPATQYKAAHPSYKKQHLIVCPIDDVAKVKPKDQIPDQQSDVRIYKQVEIYPTEKSTDGTCPVFS